MKKQQIVYVTWWILDANLIGHGKADNSFAGYRISDARLSSVNESRLSLASSASSRKGTLDYCTARGSLWNTMEHWPGHVRINDGGLPSRVRTCWTHSTWNGHDINQLSYCQKKRKKNSKRLLLPLRLWNQRSTFLAIPSKLMISEMGPSLDSTVSTVATTYRAWSGFLPECPDLLTCADCGGCCCQRKTDTTADW